MTEQLDSSAPRTALLGRIARVEARSVAVPLAKRARLSRRLLDTRHCLGEPLNTEQHAAHTLAVLAYGTALTERAQSGRWIYVCEALATGTPAAQVAVAMDVHEDDLLVGLVLWAGNQRRFGHITDEQHAAVMELVAGRGVAQWFAKRDENLQ